MLHALSLLGDAEVDADIDRQLTRLTKLTTHHILPTTYYLLPTTYYLLPTAYYLLKGAVEESVARFYIASIALALQYLHSLEVSIE